MKKIIEILKNAVIIIIAILLGLYVFFNVFFTTTSISNEGPDEVTDRFENRTP